MPATAKAPAGPRLTISSTCASLASVAWRSSGGVLTFSSLLFRQELAHLVDLGRRDRRAGIAPGDAYIGDDGRHFIVVQDVQERRHAMRPWVLARSRRVAAVQHHADGIDRSRHRDRWVRREG